MKKKIIAHLSIILIIVGVFCNVCTNYNRISFYDSSVYAEADNWTSCDSSDLVTAFRYYCKSRNLAINGSIADALTSFTTSTFNNICSTVGIDPTTLQAELKKTTDGNLGLRFLFSNTGITAYNRLFSEFLQNNDLSVGDSVDNLNVFSGQYYAEGNCLIYETDKMYVSKSGNPYANSAIKMGTPFIYDKNDFISNRGTNNTLTVSAFGVSRDFTISGSSNYQSSRYYNFSGTNSTYYETISGNLLVYEANVALIHLLSSDAYYIGYFCYGNFNNSFGERYSLFGNGQYIDIPDDTLDNADVNLTTNNTTINNNTYNNNYVIIYNDGDTYISDDDDEPLPTTPPSGGGGGGGGDNPTNPDIPPVDPTPTPAPTIPDWNIELPEMPNGNDWLLYGLEKKFPWDIPFNLMYMLSLFAADPETPHFEGTLDLKIVQWNYDIDLAPFDDIAGYVRNIEFIGFLIGLMLLTHKLIWG